MSNISLLLRAVTLCAAVGSGPPDHVTESPARVCLIVSTQQLRKVADEWAAYRGSESGGSWNAIVHVRTAPNEDPTVQRDAIRHMIRESWRVNNPESAADFAVLILGDADAIASWSFPQTDPLLQSRKDELYISDHPYQLIDDRDEVPDIPLGRVPARNADEARLVLNKVMRFESTPGTTTGSIAGRDRITYVAGEGHFGVMDNLFEMLFKKMVDRLVPPAYDISMTYAKPTSIYCPPPSTLTDTVIERLGEGSLLFNYVGHGHATGFDSLHWGDQRLPILRVQDLAGASLNADDQAQLPIAFMSCCSVGWFDLAAGKHSLAEALLFHPSGGGPVAVIAGSRITHPYANAVLQMDVTRTLLVERAPTIGLLDLTATQSLLSIDATDRELDSLTAPIARAGQWKTSLADLRTMHARLYNLLGDPATRISLPSQSITELAYADQRLSGRIEGMAAGRVQITLEADRTSMAEPQQLKAVVDSDDPELEAKAECNYRLANQRHVARYEGNVVDGRFAIEANGPPPPEADILRAYAAGTDESGTFIDAIGALRLPTTRSVPALQPTDTAPSR